MAVLRGAWSAEFCHALGDYQVQVPGTHTCMHTRTTLRGAWLHERFVSTYAYMMT